MSTENLSPGTRRVLAAMAPINGFLTESVWASRFAKPGVCDFTIGNPHEPPLPAFVEALKRWIEPRDPYWFAYKMNQPAARAVVAESLHRWRGMAFDPRDIFLTNGATSGLSVVLGAIVEPGDEVIFISPPWFQYEGMIIAAAGIPVRVGIDRATFDLDLEAIKRAISGKTRAIIINSPHNPTGKIYPPETLKGLAEILGQASGRKGSPLYLISDEAYSRIIFDHRTYHSPTSFYPASFLIYTYTKVLLTPGQRLGYIAMPPGMPHRDELRQALAAFQMLKGWAFPSALMQHALADLDQISLDLGHLQRKRDRMVSSLGEMGYEVHRPEATFYVMVRSPLADDRAMVELLSEYDIFCIPGAIMDLPGYFRISLTASDDMIDRALPGFAAALQRARAAARPNDPFPGQARE